MALTADSFRYPAGRLQSSMFPGEDLAASDLDGLPRVNHELSGDGMGVIRRFMEFHLERRFSSLAVLGS